jgi:hypothetical protein
MSLVEMSIVGTSIEVEMEGPGEGRGPREGE